MKTNLKTTGILLIMVFTFIWTSCKDEDPTLPADIFEANSFVYETTNFAYLWEQHIPEGIDFKNYQDPYALFDAMYYPTLDFWSFVTPDYQELLNSLNGIEKTSGYKITLFTYPENSSMVYGIIEYVYTGSPADNAGLSRGDVIIKVNGTLLTTSNYYDLLTLETKQLGLGELSEGNIIDLNTSVSVTSIEINLNPVLDYKVIESGGKKIGYLLYDQFIEDYFTQLQSAVSYLKSQGIDEMVLDLRFNPGGYVTTCSKLASMLAPESAIGDVFITMQWNEELTDYFTYYYGANSEYFVSNLPTTSVNLNLSRMVVLTSNGSASASEALINGLEPYMNVILVGDNTSGKYTGANFFYDEESANNKWGLYLVTNKIANANGVTDFVNGLTVDYPVQDDYKTPLGDITEPLLAQAISILTEGPVKKTQTNLLKPFSKLQQNKLKRNGIMVMEKFDAMN